MLRKVFSFLQNVNNTNKIYENDAVNNDVEFKYLTKERKNKKLKEIFSNLPRFETERLILRRIENMDYADMFEYSADPDVTKYLTWKPHEKIEDTKDYIVGLQKRYDSGKFFDWGLVCREDGRFIGTCGFTSINIVQNTCEVGYVLSKKYWGRGYMTEALECVMDFAFNYFGFYKVEARFIEGNINSQKVMQKMGMLYERVNKNALHVKGEYKNVHTYTITIDEFENRKKALNKTVVNVT